MGISVPSFFKERKFSFIFTLLLPLACITILLFTKTTTNAHYPLFFYSDLQTSPSSSQPISPPAPFNPAGEPPQGDELVWEEPIFPVFGIPNWNLCTGLVAVDYIPCLDNSEAIKALKSRRHMEHRERHYPQAPPRCRFRGLRAGT
nr:probable methyltransferase PMT23 [Malus domestica]